MEIGIAFDLRGTSDGSGPSDRFEEYDSPSTVEAVAAALESLGHGVRRLGGGRELVHELVERPPELVFNMAEGAGTRSREAHVPAVCELLGVAYTGSDPLTLAASLDKGVAKSLLAAAGVPTPRWQVVDDAGADVRLELPALAKPLAEGSSMGIRLTSRAESRDELRAHLERLLRDYGQPALVEEFCPGPEFTVGILDGTPLGVMEIVPLQAAVEDFVYSVEVKRRDDLVEAHVPPRRPRALVERVETTAVAAYRALGCRDVARVDVRLAADGEPQVLEVNPLPGLSPGWSDLAVIADATGLGYDGLIAGILESACERQGL